MDRPFAPDSVPPSDQSPAACHGGQEDFESIRSEVDDSASSAPVYDILTYPADYPLSVISDRWEKGSIAAPEFQRRYIWTQAQASRLIESFLLGLPVPPVYLHQDASSANSLKVIDGLQRIKTIADFYAGDFARGTASGDLNHVTAFALTGLSPGSPYSGRTLDSLIPDDRARLDDLTIRAYVVRQLNPAGHDSIPQIFERLNTGGTLLCAQEIRNCVYGGTFNGPEGDTSHISGTRRGHFPDFRPDRLTADLWPLGGRGRLTAYS